MLNLAVVFESMRRHWLPVLLITLMCSGLGFVSSYVKEGTVDVAPVYTAEATIYVNGYASSEVNAFNYQLSDSMLTADARRVIVSNEVAGEVRRSLGEDIKISSPFWINQKTNADFSTHFIFVDATASSEELALSAAKMAAVKAESIIKNTLPVTTTSVMGDPVLSLTNAKAGDFGVDKLAIDGESSVAAVASGVNVKNVLISVFLGLFGSVFVFVIWDVLTKKLRSENDIERMLDLPVLATLQSADQGVEYLANILKVLAKKNNLLNVLPVGFVSTDNSVSLGNKLSSITDGLVTSGVTISGSVDAVSRMSNSSSILLVISESAAKRDDIERGIRQMEISGTPVLGAVFISKKKQRGSKRA